MKAVLQDKYGGVEQLHLEDVVTPTYKDNELLIEVHTSNVASGDMKVNTLQVPPVLKPIMKLIFGIKGPRQKIRGISGAGVIKEVGSKVTKYSVGESVYFINSMKAGCMAEYVVLNEKSILAPIPQNISFEEAAPLSFGAMSAYHFINEKTIKKDDEVVIYGASGSIGTYALQLAKYYGANVTAIASKKHHTVLKTIGADCIVDYTVVDFREQTKKYDVIFDAVGKINKKSCKHILKPGGKYLSIKLPTKEDSNRLLALNKIIEENQLKTVIDQVYDFTEYKEAHQKTYSGHKQGNVVIKWR